MTLKDLLSKVGTPMDILDSIGSIAAIEFPILLIADDGKEFEIMHIIIEFTSNPKLCLAIEETN